MGFTANEVWGTTPPGVQIPPSPRLAPVPGPGPFAYPARPGAGHRAPVPPPGWQDKPVSSNRAVDATSVGGGHNGLAAAAYLSKAGRKVLLLEKLDHPG